jgi:hypothetical protein
MARSVQQGDYQSNCEAFSVESVMAKFPCEGIGEKMSAVSNSRVVDHEKRLMSPGKIALIFQNRLECSDIEKELQIPKNADIA